MSIDWAAIKSKLPLERTTEGKEQRKKLFNKFDVNGNGILSLAEIDKAMRDELQCDCLFDAKPAILRAFEAAKNVGISKRKDIGDDYVEVLEFRCFLNRLRMYFEYYEAFSRVDCDGDKRIDLDEFKEAEVTIKKWVKDFDAERDFKKIDTNGGGYILFDEFCKWAMDQDLDLEDDDDCIVD